MSLFLLMKKGGIAVLALLAYHFAAAQVILSPVLVEFGARQRIASVAISLSNNAAPMRLQADLLKWDQDAQGEPLLDPSDDLLVTPPIADLRPGTTQIFRVALRGARPAPQELAYRLIFEDVAESAKNTASGAAMNVQFRMRYDLPVLLAPLGPVVNDLNWKACPIKPPVVLPAETKVSVPTTGETCVRIRNAGNRRVKVQNLTLSGDGWQHSLPFKDGINVLSGAEREWRIPMQAGQTGTLQRVQVLTARGETIDAQAARF